MPERHALPNDADLIKRLLARDEQAFTLVVRTYHGRMLYLARTFVGEAVADEVVQEAWLAVIKALPAFEGRSSLKTWILRILTNLAKSRLRHEVRSIAVGDLWDEDSPALPAARFDTSGYWKTPPLPWHEETPEAILGSDELRDCLKKALAALPLLQREVITLRDIEGLTMADICNILEVKETHARVLLHRARARVRSAIEDYQRGKGC